MANTAFALETKKDDAGLKYLEWLRDAAASGKSLTGVVRDVASLLWGEGRLQPSEYFLYKLYDDDRFPPEVKKTFLGTDRLAQLLSALDMPWPVIANDKPTLTALLRGNDLPIPETQAMRHADRAFPGAKALRNRSDVENFLRHEAQYPIFTKPTDGRCSLGVANLERYDRTSDCVITKRGQSVPIAEMADQVERFAQGGYLFQSRLAPHPKIAEIVGDQVSSVRMFVLADDEGPTLLRAAWKIPSGESVADNFWRAGNMLGGIDVETGRVIRVLRRTPKATIAVDSHPKTGASFRELEFPEWSAMRDVVMRGAAAVPSCHFQGWDVALTDRGPVLVELEGDGGDPIMEQLCFDSGLLQGRYLNFATKALAKPKEKKKEARARLRERLHANLSQLTANHTQSHTNA
ncbi:MAG TPA: sugar-transfer associated ATP-grasp domain-containing protein [Lacipirellulaceae bacterium]|nr:sugar-transfer associated ATP-grasp domain-containing protein [Lacipirellulaceae bacterium]